MPQKNRPLSPHLSVYKLQITSALSIMHRITGVGLAFGALLLVVFLASLMVGPESYQAFAIFMDNILMQLVLVGLVIALVYHFFSGLRHLFWDVGRGYDIKTVYTTGWLVLAATAVCSAFIVWSILW